MENTFSSFWNRNKILFKSFLIGLLTLLLLIPTVFIRELISERAGRQQEALAEVSAKWAGGQTVTGPVITIPYTELQRDADGKTFWVRRLAYFLPDQLSIHANIIPEKRYRGIYQVIVYTTEMQISGSYDSLRIADLNIDPQSISWNEAAVFFNISDVRGLKEEVKLQLNQKELDLVPGKLSNEQFKDALSAVIPAGTAIDHGAVHFSMTVQLKGSEHLSFTPTGKQTEVTASSSWSNPSFTGNYLPDIRSVKDSGFNANWKVLYLNRAYPQQWKDKTYAIEASSFGVNLFVPVDAYQQTMRSVKYALLCIVLTFTAFFLIELIYAKTIHSLQYVLVGFALCIFYTLLLSFSEYINFNIAYLIASVATILLIAWYVRNILQSSKMGGFMAFLLTAMYGFIFILIQLQDYALLMGSIGLFATLGIVMYFSRKIKWSA